MPSARALALSFLAPLLVSAAADAQDHALTPSTAPQVEVPPPMDVPFEQIVDPARHVPGSVSVGTTSDGDLRGSAQLPDESSVHFVLPEHRARDTHHGTDELLALIQDAATRVYEQTGARVAVGNMSAPRGGDIVWSRSHNAGRDVDLAFPIVDAGGAVVEPPTLVQVRRSGEARGFEGWRFDVATGWVLVEALLTSDVAQVQWIFVYDPLKQALLAHAREIGADPGVVALAADILHQPGDSAPHDDHFHVRIFCSRDDVLEGCTNWGPEWQHAALWTDAVSTRVDELMRGALSPDADTARECLARANQLAGRRLVPALAAALPHAYPETQLVLMEYLAEYDEPGVAAAIVPLLESAAAPQTRDQAAWLLGYLADPTAAAHVSQLVARLVAAGDVDAAVRAAHALRNVWHADSVPALAQVADAADDPLRQELDRVLSRATGWRPPLTPAETGAANTWSQWWAENANGQQADWYLRAFRAAGYDVGDDWSIAPFAELVRALRDPADHIRFIADRALLTRTSGWTPSEGWSIDQRYRYWSRRLGVR